MRGRVPHPVPRCSHLNEKPPNPAHPCEGVFGLAHACLEVASGQMLWSELVQRCNDVFGSDRCVLRSERHDRPGADLVLDVVSSTRGGRQEPGQVSRPVAAAEVLDGSWPSEGDFLAATIEDSPEARASIILYRLLPFTDADLERLDSLLPFLRGALAARRQRYDQGVSARIVQGLQRSLGFGVMLVAADGRLRYADAAARAVLRSHAKLGVAIDRISCDEPTTTLRLRRAIAHVATTGERVALRLDGGEEDLELLLVGANRDMAGPSSDTRCGEVAICLVDAGAAREAAPDLLQELYALTPAEAVVAARLVAGLSVQEVADTLDVAVSTVRSHLRRLFAKTGTSRQGELVSQLGGGLARLMHCYE